ncbi:MAG: hypothetical protein WAQ98_07465 [Blastocatellia bacterium]
MVQLNILKASSNLSFSLKPNVNSELPENNFCYFSEADIFITIKRTERGFELSNGCRCKIISPLETFSIKEHFGIDKWAILVETINQEQLQELWLIYPQRYLSDCD